MSPGDLLTLVTVAAAVLLMTPFLGRYIHRVTEGERVFLSPVVRPIERARRATHVVIPHREVSGFKRLLEKPLADTLIERLPEIEVHVVGAKAEPTR